MKKLFTILLAALLIVSMSGFAVAGELTGKDVADGKDNMTSQVTLDLDNTYTVTLPDTFIFGKLDSETYYHTKGLIEVEITVFNASELLFINVTSNNYTNNNWTLKDENGVKSLPYYMKVGGTNDHVVNPDNDKFANDKDNFIYYDGTIIKTNVTDTTKYIHLKIPEIVTETGKYSDKLKFTISIKPNPEV